MKIANLAGRLVLTDGTAAVDVETASEGRFSSNVQSAYEVWDALQAWAATVDVAARGAEFAPEELLSPVPRPTQLFAIGLNYRDHAAESGFDVPEGIPPVFTKFASSISGPYTDVVRPAGNVDWEVELGVVIKKEAHRVKAADAWDYVAGLTVTQDISERAQQLSGPAPQFSLAKSHTGFTPIGPWVVPLAEVSDPENLRLTCSINGETVQDGTTAEMIFPVPVLIERLSSIVTLYPGDLIMTGTPAGVGMGLTPPRYLNVGDVLETEIAEVGTLRQRFVAP